uniref:Hexosyltransferase n=1 Tax=Canis lupus dingo TaxID=286419 RepID=A0A8C0KKK3_CANLU
MGGPGMIFSREVLRRMVPHIGECLREMYTTHEDVEVGRCVRRFGGTQCVWSYEIAGTCHEKEQEIILRCSLTSFPESKATIQQLLKHLESLTRLLGKNDTLFLCVFLHVSVSSVPFSLQVSFHGLTVYTAIDGHCQNSHSAWCSPIHRATRFPFTQICHYKEG